MDVRTGETIITHRTVAHRTVAHEASAGDASLAGLTATAFSAMFHAWRGASERRYVTSVYPVDLAADDFGLPGFDAFVLVPVSRERVAYRPLAIVAVERESDRRFAIADALAQGVDQWHVHLMAADRRARATVVADLAARHGMTVKVALSA